MGKTWICSRSSFPKLHNFLACYLFIPIRTFVKSLKRDSLLHSLDHIYNGKCILEKLKWNNLCVEEPPFAVCFLCEVENVCKFEWKLIFKYCCTWVTQAEFNLDRSANLYCFACSLKKHWLSLTLEAVECLPGESQGSIEERGNIWRELLALF